MEEERKNFFVYKCLFVLFDPELPIQQQFSMGRLRTESI